MNQDRVVAALIAVLLLAQARQASLTHLNADEALHYLLANQNSWSDALALTQANAHPPLLTLLVGVWSRLATSELALRLIPLIASGAMLWFTYRWAWLALGRTAALAMTVLLACAPPVFALTIELRPYTLLLCGVSLGWWSLEEALRRKSPRWMALSAAGLALAMLAHFSALFAIAGAGLYALWRLRERQWPRDLLLPWLGGQAVLLAMLSAFVSQLLSLRSSEMARQVRESWLAAFQCPAGDVVCAGSKLGLVLEFFFAAPWLGAVVGLLAASGFVWLSRDRDRRGVAILLGTTLAAALGATALGEYPMGASRHSVLTAYVLLAAAVASFGKFLETRPRLVAGAAVAVAALPLLLLPVNDAQRTTEAEQRRELMHAGVAYLRSSVRPGGLVFTDYQSAMLLCYYWDPRRVCSDPSGRPLLDFDLGTIRLAVSRTWSLDPTPFAEELQQLKRQFQLPRGAEVWVFDAGWGSPVNRPLAVQFGGSQWPGLREFGEHIGVFRIPN